MLLIQVLMVNLMRLSNCTEVDIIGTRKPVEALMYEHVVNEEIRKPVKKNSNSDEEAEIKSCNRTEDD